MIELHEGDCLNILPTIESEIVDCVVIDPPYFGIVKDEWDNQWKTRDDFINWLEFIIIELKRILKSNGSLYIFADDKICAYVQVMIDKHLTLLNSIVWHKPNNLPVKNAHLLRSYAPMTERILFYTPELDYIETPFSVIMKNKMIELNLSQNDISKLELSRNGNITGWVHNKLKGIQIPTPEQWVKICELFKIENEYSNLIEEYESLRRTFNAGNGRFDVIQEKIITRKENTSHSTTKPTRLIKQFIEASTNKGDLVLDCFFGSGTTGVSCKYLDRDFIGIEKDPISFKKGKNRINGAKFEIIEDKPHQLGF